MQVPTPARAAPASSIRKSVCGLAQKPMPPGRCRDSETTSTIQGDATPSAPLASPPGLCARTSVFKQNYPSSTSESRPQLLDTVATSELWDLTRARSSGCGDTDQKSSCVMIKI